MIYHNDYILPKSFYSELEIDIPEYSPFSINSEQLIARDLEASGNSEGPFQFAEVFPGSYIETHGKWSELPGGKIWSIAFRIPGAKSLSFELESLRFENDDAVWIYSEDGSGIQGPLEREDLDEDGALITGTLLGDNGTIEIFFKDFVSNMKTNFRVKSIIASYRDVTQADIPCFVNVNCPVGAAYDRQKRAVVIIRVDGKKLVTGTLINNTSNDGRPFLLTSRHNGITPDNAKKIEVYWNNEVLVCGKTGVGMFNERQVGANWLAEWKETDFTLLELKKVPNKKFQVYYSGWDRSSLPKGEFIGIHHPHGHPKNIAVADDIESTNSYPKEPNSGHYWKVPEWRQGSTDKGSSGSGLWTKEGHLIGQLKGGKSSCNKDLPGPDWYGKFSESWEGGGDKKSSLKTWLDPEQTNMEKLNGFQPTYEDRDYHVLENAIVSEIDRQIFLENLAKRKARNIKLSDKNKTTLKVFDLSKNLSLPNKKETTNSDIFLAVIEDFEKPVIAKPDHKQLKNLRKIGEIDDLLKAVKRIAL